MMHIENEKFNVFVIITKTNSTLIFINKILGKFAKVIKMNNSIG